ncbi:ROK family protein [Streptacidiphilus sp. N1-12]|uniref:ROK family protein n=2 Tax=Streptacidiphilus alkalitolerans TaxID=3342712 RepID=A0ABV6WMX2_9ACTN
MKADLHGTGARELAMAGLPKVSDRSSIRRSNLGLVLRLLRDEGPRSRARIATDTGLPKATVSSLVTELVESGLAREGEVEREGTVGRPGLAVEIDGSTVCGIGAEINVDYLSILALDLRGTVTAERRIAFDVRTASPDAVLDAIADTIRRTVDELRADGIRTIGVTLAAPGVIDMKRGRVSYASNIGWRDVDALAGLARRLGPDAPPLHLENDAKLGAIAEYLAVSAPDMHDLLYLTGEIGVGAGIIAGGQLLRGTAGHAGEVGHLPLDPGGRLCACGRRGCWETQVGLAALLRAAADPDDPVCDPSVDLEQRLAELMRRAKAGDPRTLGALDAIATALGPGIALLLDVLNPQLLVLGGHFAFFGQYLIDQVRHTVHQTVMAPDAGGCEIALSTLGFTAAARGGACLALDAVYQDPAGSLLLQPARR